ncbi:MAG: hypothetical protein A3B41_04145 [Candidatus Levybacteria bacterium RIFCSPLOWO2_01_FULL_37_26]|nr:MAG: hypothetical protein A3E40_01245 [Candidatus Levybacteria bacterium RIFCSPHIGHO2_12_FULL_37_9]OGH39911.1 MAG: hypothetical protein A3B41_04145 [Candidatus Levybacteria bacterium RIFCSPLOWO2_01_FULL_37_26]
MVPLVQTVLASLDLIGICKDGFLSPERKLIMGNYQERGIVFNSEQEKFVTRRMVVKIGSSTITGNTESLDVNFMENIARQVSLLFHSGVEVMIVTSGAVASGKKGLDGEDNTTVSIYGQTILITNWHEVLKKNGVKDVGHLLLTDNHLVDGIGDILSDALRCGVLVINGQDAVNELSKSKICKDNDQLAEFLAKSINADTLLLLTDKDGVLDENQKTIEVIDSNTKIGTLHESKEVYSGGIDSKIQVAIGFAGKAVIANGRTEDIILKVAQGKKERNFSRTI